MIDYQMIRLEGMKTYGFGSEAMKKVKVCRLCKCICDAGEYYCRECGVVLPRETLFDLYKSHHLYCPVCETVVADTVLFCPKCGKRLRK